MCAKIVIAQLLYDAAFRHSPVARCFDDPAQLSLEELEPGDLSVYGSEMFCGEHIGPIAGTLRLIRQAQQRADCLYRKTELARVLDKGQPPDGIRSVEPPITLGTRGLWKKADLLIEANRRGLHGGGLREGSDRHRHQVCSVAARNMEIGP